nr:NADH dehydrogenase subunit 3 [Glottidia pyramidata]
MSGFVFTSWLYMLSYSYHLSKDPNWSPFSVKNKNQSSPYECGFAPMTLTRLPFSLRFYLISILFIIFDVEVVLLSGVPICIRSGVLSDCYASIFLFILVMYLGLMYETYKGALNWAPFEGGQKDFTHNSTSGRSNKSKLPERATL